MTEQSLFEMEVQRAIAKWHLCVLQAPGDPMMHYHICMNCKRIYATLELQKFRPAKQSEREIMQGVARVPVN